GEGVLGGGVVGTQMSNLGLELALKAQGIAFMRAAVGDRYVMELLRQQDWLLGGESSGHILCLDRTSTGDGIVSALQVLAIMQTSGKPLSELRRQMTKFPQTLVNVPLDSGVARDALLDARGVREAVRAAEQTLGEEGRVLLRPSGTEPLIRVMVEGREARQVERIAREIAQAVRAVADHQG
ncbi:MAG TPA: phosphoglucosamine mutase, partial [Thioalkalivibrio sp.]|nr:phosphoglucosamine mutase [Thioalkalivibrio sp.]